MGRGGKRGRGRGRGARSNGPTREGDGQANRTDVLGANEMHNARFEAYYTRQNLVSDEEWPELLKAARAPLPTTFRIAAGRETAQVLKDAIEKTYVPHLQDVVFEGEAVDPPKQLSWYPGGLGWQFNVAKKVLRKSPEFKRFHSFLVYETEVGNVTRQEAVSMLPPLFLDVQPHHKVMDMCAAPGSKTSQLLEFLHASTEPGAQSIPPGLLVANDSDYKRAQLLIHQSARLPSPAFLVTNMDASNYPTLSLGTSSSSSSASTATKKPKMKGLPANTTPLLFDRILCDVPCSGDGTLRKNVGIWKTWNPMDGNGLHGLQTRILSRAMRMLEQGGRIVYSTCSLNPVENEAVIAEALRTVKGFELVDVSTHLPSLNRASGLHTWVPATDRQSTFHTTYTSYIDSIPEDKRAFAKMLKSHWPPSEEEREGLHLERCMRIYPHMQDTGGFFVAVLERKARVRKEGEGKKIEKRSAEEVDGAGAEPAGKKPRLEGDETAKEAPADVATAAAPAVDESATAEGEADEEMSGEKEKEPTPPAADGSFKEMPYTYLAPDDPLVEAAITASCLLPAFPRHNLLKRGPGGEIARSLYLTNDLVRSVVDNNDFARIRLMAAGTRVFTRQEGGFGAKGEKAKAMEASGATEGQERRGERPSVWRMLSEGLPAVLPFVEPSSIIEADADALRVLVAEYYPLLSAFASEYKAILEGKSLGSHVSRFRIPPSSTHDRELELCLPIWRSANSASLMIDKKAKSALSLRVFGEDVSVAGREAAKKAQEGRKSKAATPGAEADAETAVEGEAVVDGDVAAEVGAQTSAVAEGAAVAQDVEMKE